MPEDREHSDKYYTELEYIINRFDQEDLTSIEEEELFDVIVSIKIAQKAVEKTLGPVENKSDIIPFAIRIYERIREVKRRKDDIEYT